MLHPYTSFWLTANTQLYLAVLLLHPSLLCHVVPTVRVLMRATSVLYLLSSKWHLPALEAVSVPSFVSTCVQGS